jgi:hypothetical protein
MATRIDTIERDGETVYIYDDGMEYSKDRGRIVKAPKKYQITPENSCDYLRKRQQKAARLLRERVLAATQDVSDVKLTGPAHAIAETAGILWSEIVLNDKAYPRDRLEGWEKIGKYAQVLPADVRKPDGDGIPAQADTVNALAGFLEQLRGLLDDMQRLKGDT